MYMSNAVENAKTLIKEEKYKETLKLARKRHGKDDIEEYLEILDLLIEKDYLLALEEKGLYFQYYDPTHGNGDYGEVYFDKYLEKQPKSINVICDKALCRFNKNHVDEALEYMDKAYEKYSSYSKIEKPRIKKEEVLMGKIELLMQNKDYKDALTLLNQYENSYPPNNKLDLYKGQALQKTGENEASLEYLTQSIDEEPSIIGLNSKGDALYELGRYKDALSEYNKCIKYEREATDDLELISNFNSKAGFCAVKMGNEKKAVQYFNKTINMLNEKGRLPKDIEEIYQKCSFEKERIIKTGKVNDEEFKQSRFLSLDASLKILIVIIILFIILKILGY